MILKIIIEQFQNKITLLTFLIFKIMTDTKTYVVPDYQGDNDFAKMALLNNGGMNGWGK